MIRAPVHAPLPLHSEEDEAIMTVTDSTRAFEATIARYEAGGWDVRTIDHTERRATVRAGTTVVRGNAPGVMFQVDATASGCRKVWVDSKGEVQETDVPC